MEGETLFRGVPLIVPYRMERLPDGRYRVINTASGKVHAKRTTKRKAEAQIRVMNQAEGR